MEIITVTTVAGEEFSPSALDLDESYVRMRFQADVKHDLLVAIGRAQDDEVELEATYAHREGPTYHIEERLVLFSSTADNTLEFRIMPPARSAE